MTKSGKLSNVEKFQIQQLLVAGKTVAEIGVEVDRSPTSVQNYIDGELAKVVESVTRAAVQVEDARNEDVIRRVYNRFIKQGLIATDVNKIIKIALENVEREADGSIDEHKLYNKCLTARSKDIGTFMVKKTESGNGGIGIMTEGASQRWDAVKDRPRKTARRLSGNVFNPKTGEYIG